MSDDPNNDGDISSGFGDSSVTGRVSDEKAEKMLRPGPPVADAEGSSDSDEDLAQK